MVPDANTFAAAVQPSNEDLTGFLEAAGDWAFSTDKSFTITYCHKSEGAPGGILPENLLGQPFENFLPRRCRGEVMEKLRAFAAHKGRRQVIEFEDRLAPQMLQVSGRWGESGFLGCKMVVQKAASLSAGAAAQEDGQLYRQELITRLSMELAGTSDLDATLGSTLRQVGEYLEVSRCSLNKRDIAAKTYSRTLEWVAPGTAPMLPHAQNLPYREDEIGYVELVTRPYIAIEDTAAYGPEIGERERAAGIHAFIYLPLSVNGGFWGFLGVEACGAPRTWARSELHFLQTVSGLIAFAIEKREMQDVLYESFSRMEGIVTSFPGLIWSTDTDYRFTLFEGKGMESLFAMKESLVGVSIHQLAGVIPDEMIQTHEITFREGPQSYNVEIAGLYLSCHTNLIRNRAGEVRGIVGVAIDVTDMHNMQIKLENAIDAAEKASQAKSEFLSRMSHEIRTPMNAIIGMTTIARKSQELAKIAFCLDKIDDASRQLLATINDILDMSKIEANKFEITSHEFDFEEMLQSIFNVIGVRMEEKNQNFTFEFTTLFQHKVIGDELRLSQVLLNLLSNASKFTPEGGDIALRIRHVMQPDGRCTLHAEVEDNGIGISAEQQSRLFQSFEQADGGITRRFGGTGLGLAICKKIVTLMNGDIWVESAPGQGSTFIFEADIQLGAPLHEGPPAAAFSTDLNILVVDDSEDVLLYFSNVLESFQMRCDTATSGEEAEKLARQSVANGRPYDLVFIDWKMPGMDGVQTARAVRAHLHGDAILVMISGADWSVTETESREIGITRFLPKPILPSVLFNTIVEIGERPAPQKPQNVDAAAFNWRGSTILLAEDLEINRIILCSMLEETGVAIECAEDGEAAVEMFLQQPDKYALILMDVQMPKLDGLGATRRIRSSGAARAGGIPIIAMTANVFKEDVRECLEAGMNDHIAKPIDVDDLLGKLMRYLGDGTDKQSAERP